MSEKNEPQGLPFLREVANLLTTESGATCRWEAAAGVRRLSICRGDRRWEFQFADGILEAPDSEGYRRAALDLFNTIQLEIRRDPEAQ